jgi:TonB-dependent starch-binding outer membrane protein SusC
MRAMRLIFSLVILLQYSISFASISVSIQDTVRNQLNDNIEAGYYTLNSGELSGSLAPVPTGSFNRGTIHNSIQLIQGGIPGVIITRPGSDPNADFVIRIRGIATGQTGEGPLYVIDGFVGISPSTIDPADIESFTILKDAAASSLYGVRGSQGVVIIQTKSGLKNLPQVEYNASVAFDRMSRRPPVLSAGDFRKLSGATDYGSSQDWIDLVSRNATSTVHNVAISGGADQTQYRASLNYRLAEGILNNSGFSQWNARINLKHRMLNDRLTFDAHLGSMHRIMNYGFTETFRYAILVNPTMPVYNDTGENGGYFQLLKFDYFNPVAIQKQNTHEGNYKNTVMQTKVMWDLKDWAPGLTVSTSYGRSVTQESSGAYYSKHSLFRGMIRNGLAMISTQLLNSDLFEMQLNYIRQFKQNRVGVMGGYSFQRYDTELMGATGGNFLTDAFSYRNLGASLDFNNGSGTVFSNKDVYKVITFYGRSQINFTDKYILTVAASRSGSTRLGANNKWGIFPSVSAAAHWNEILKWQAFRQFTLRASWGKSGNIPNVSYLSHERYAPSSSYYFYNGTYLPFIQQSSNDNPDLKWEEKTELTVGADIDLANSPINFSIDIFNNKVEDLILPVSLPSPPYPVGGGRMNVGAIENRGVEISLNHTVVNDEDFRWSWSVNYTRVNSTITRMSNMDAQFGRNGLLYTGFLDGPGGCGCFGTIRIKEDEPVGQLFGPVFNGVNESGYPVFKDINKDGSHCFCQDDFAVLGSAMPKYIYGIFNNVRYKNWTAGVLIRRASGHKLINSYRIYQENRLASQLDYNLFKTKHYLSDLQTTQFSSHYVERAGYIKLDNAFVQYQVPVRQESSISKLALSLAWQNLFTITRYTGLDPEVRYRPAPISFGGSADYRVDAPFSMGNEGRNNYPVSGTFTLGLTAAF